MDEVVRKAKFCANTYFGPITIQNLNNQSDKLQDSFAQKLTMSYHNVYLSFRTQIDLAVVHCPNVLIPYGQGGTLGKECFQFLSQTG